MTIHATCAALPTLVLDTAWRVQSAPSPARAISGPAGPAAQPQKPDGLALMIRREVLFDQASRAKMLRRSKQASIYEADLRAVTLELLRGHDAGE